MTLPTPSKTAPWTYFPVVPPALAVGLHFPAWHSLRHVVAWTDHVQGIWAGATGSTPG